MTPAEEGRIVAAHSARQKAREELLELRERMAQEREARCDGIRAAWDKPWIDVALLLEQIHDNEAAALHTEEVRHLEYLDRHE